MGNVIDNIVKVWTNYSHLFMQGLGVTIALSIVTVIMGSIFGFLLMLLRRSRFNIFRFRPLNFIAAAYIEIIRGTPMLLQLYFFYFLLPEMVPFLDLSKLTCCLVAMCVNSAAYVSEVFRSGIEAVDKGQTEAARSLGLSSRQTMIHVVLPQAVKNVLPALCNEFIMMIKDTSLASTFFVGELMSVYRTVSGILFLTIEPLIIVGIIYFIVTFVLSKCVRLLEMKLTVA
ncbi:MAG TPA: amino acid ABC transporter permease [Candidatus Avilachnospira avistercoris]|nr:amino acid ABC transporter permease [Candidatus Avilachnospira avistercoris]